MQHEFQPTFDSLRTFQAPAWFRDAKFGIWSHWGPQSVPMFGDWYARNMYIEGTPQYLYHLRHFGHPSKIGYKDLCHLWKAEAFEPDQLMDLYVQAGAKYFVALATHHDHFFNYPSQYNPMNSATVGPKKDILGLWKAAAKKHGLPFGLSEHLGASFSWWRVNKGQDTYGPYAGVPYDGTDPAYRHFYHANEEYGASNPEDFRPWYTANQDYHAYWLACITEMIDRYTPELLYTDGPLPFGADWSSPPDLPRGPHLYREGLQAVAHLYNTSMAANGQNLAVYAQKDRDQAVYSVGVLDIEKSQLPGINPDPWQTDTCIGNWFYDVRQTYKRPEQIVEMLIDIASKNGNMLLNVLQRPDGSIDDETRYILQEIAKWTAICGEGIFGTRPWRVYGEGPTTVKIEGFTENKTEWHPSDIRFTCKGSALYAFLMGGAQDRVTIIRSLCQGETVRNVHVLGGGSVPFAHDFGVLTVQMPETMPAPYTNALVIELA